jgi:hypothetical protein
MSGMGQCEWDKEPCSKAGGWQLGRGTVGLLGSWLASSGLVKRWFGKTMGQQDREAVKQ